MNTAHIAFKENIYTNYKHKSFSGIHQLLNKTNFCQHPNVSYPQCHLWTNTIKKKSMRKNKSVIVGRYVKI